MRQSNKRPGPGSVFLLSGSSSGIGEAIAKILVGRGCTVYGAARRYSQNWPDQPEQPDQSKGRSGRFYALKLDVQDEQAAKDAVSRIIEREGRIDGLILAAGYGLAGAVEDTSPAEASGQLRINLVGALTLLQPVLQQMRRQQNGRIAFLSSMAAIVPIPFQAFYSASKAALDALALALADEVQPFGIQCMIVHPGDTRTGFTEARVVSEASGPDSAYYARCHRSFTKMARDEENGLPAETAARLVIRQLYRRRMPPCYTPGLIYKLIVILKRLLPTRLARYLVARIYAR